MEANTLDDLFSTESTRSNPLQQPVGRLGEKIVTGKGLISDPAQVAAGAGGRLGACLRLAV